MLARQNRFIHYFEHYWYADIGKHRRGYACKYARKNRQSDPGYSDYQNAAGRIEPESENAGERNQGKYSSKCKTDDRDHAAKEGAGGGSKAGRR